MPMDGSWGGPRVSVARAPEAALGETKPEPPNDFHHQSGRDLRIGDEKRIAYDRPRDHYEDRGRPASSRKNPHAPGAADDMRASAEGKALAK